MCGSALATLCAYRLDGNARWYFTLATDRYTEACLILWVRLVAIRPLELRRGFCSTFVQSLEIWREKEPVIPISVPKFLGRGKCYEATN
jgi:hypothetical protein